MGVSELGILVIVILFLPGIFFAARKFVTRAPIVTKSDAKRRARETLWCACFVAIATATLATVATLTASSVRGIDGWAYIDAILFAAIALGAMRYSRISAVAGPALFFFEQCATMYSRGVQPGGAVVGLLIFAGFLRGAAGTFAYHRMAQADALTEKNVQTLSQPALAQSPIAITGPFA